MGGKMIWFIVLTYAGIVAAAFWVANSENTKATAAKSLAESAIKHAEALDAQIIELKKSLEDSERRSDEAYKKLVEIMLSNDERGSKLKEKLEWLEMKVSNMPKASPSPSKVVLSQDKPIQFTIITRQGPPVKAKPKLVNTRDPKMSEDEIKSRMIKDIKKKVNELSQ